MLSDPQNTLLFVKTLMTSVVFLKWAVCGACQHIVEDRRLDKINVYYGLERGNYTVDGISTRAERENKARQWKNVTVTLIIKEKKKNFNINICFCVCAVSGG